MYKFYKKYQNLIHNDQFFDQNSHIFVLLVLLGGLKHEIFKKVNTGILLSLRTLWASNTGFLKNAEPDPFSLGF